MGEGGAGRLVTGSHAGEGATSGQWGSWDGPAKPPHLHMTYDLYWADVKAAFPPCQATAVNQLMKRIEQFDIEKAVTTAVPEWSR
jgi:hypothetical protein